MTELQLIENPNPYWGEDLKSQAMQIAGGLRAEGMDASEALEEGWRQAKGEYRSGEYEALDLPSGVYDNPDEDMILVEAPKRRRRANPDGGSGIVTLTLLGYLAWCGYRYYQRQYWSWTPWRNSSVSRLISEADQIARRGG